MRSGEAHLSQKHRRRGDGADVRHYRAARAMARAYCSPENGKLSLADRSSLWFSVIPVVNAFPRN
jgi:hypothetical protein